MTARWNCGSTTNAPLILARAPRAMAAAKLALGSAVTIAWPAMAFLLASAASACPAFAASTVMPCT